MIEVRSCRDRNSAVDGNLIEFRSRHDRECDHEREVDRSAAPSGPEQGCVRQFDGISASSRTGIQSGTESNRSAAPWEVEQAVDGNSTERRPRDDREFDTKIEARVGTKIDPK